MTRPDREAHRVLEERHREVDGRLRRRIAEMAEVLQLSPAERQAFLLAGERAAHLHTADCALVDHEFRSGRSSPAEDEATREAIAEREWDASLGRLRTAVAAARAAAEAEAAPEEEDRHYRVRYRPISRLTRQPSTD